MDLVLENNLQNEIEIKQNNFLQSTLGGAINNGINLGIRYLLPDFVEDKAIELKDNLLNYGLKEGISKTIKSTIETGKSVIGIFTGNFENVKQINEAVKSGGIIDSVSNLLDDVLYKVKSAGKIDNTAYRLIKNGKDTILNNVEKNVESALNEQIGRADLLAEHIESWKVYYQNQDFNGMEKEYQKMKKELKNLVPIEETINTARGVENLHNLIKNNGQNFSLSIEEKELISKF